MEWIGFAVVWWWLLIIVVDDPVWISCLILRWCKHQWFLGYCLVTWAYTNSCQAMFSRLLSREVRRVPIKLIIIIALTWALYLRTLWCLTIDEWIDWDTWSLDLFCLRIFGGFGSSVFVLFTASKADRSLISFSCTNGLCSIDLRACSVLMDRVLKGELFWLLERPLILLTLPMIIAWVEKISVQSPSNSVLLFMHWVGSLFCPNLVADLIIDWLSLRWN